MKDRGDLGHESCDFLIKLLHSYHSEKILLNLHRNVESEGPSPLSLLRDDLAPLVYSVLPLGPALELISFQCCDQTPEVNSHSPRSDLQ